MISFPLHQPVAIFLLVLMIILLAPILFNRLKIPHIVGMIIAGILVGPHGFNLLARDASFEIFGQVGILYLMFLAAVEIDTYHLKKNIKKGIIFGLITFTIPMAAGIIASRYAFNASWPSCVLIASMYASHTLISYPIVTRFGLSNSRAVVISVCGTIVTVFLALVALAQVVDVQTSGKLAFSHVAQLLLHTAIYTIGISVTFKYLARLFFRHYSDHISQFIFVLALVFIASLLAQLIGLEAILGAFYAGLVLNRFIPNRSALMNRIQFVGNAIFIPYFLIGVGMLINVEVIFNGWGVAWVAGNMIVTALAAKWISALIAQKAFHLTSTDRELLFGLTSGKAAATIAATIVGYRYGIINEDMMNGAVIMILICSSIASIATQRAAIRIRIGLTDEHLKNDEIEQRKNARQLVAVANPLTAEGLMKMAILMRHPENNLRITSLFVKNNDDSKIATMGKNALRVAHEVATSLDLTVKDIERYDLNIVSGIVNVAKERDCTDIIIGMHRKSNIVDSFYGQVTENLLSTTNKMVLISRCYIPANTLRRLIIFVPQKAEYETGFQAWVERVGNLATQLSCRIEFIAYAQSFPYIRGVLSTQQYSVRTEYLEMKSWDDFIVYSSRIQDDDLLIVIGARRTSVSFSSDLESLPGYLNSYFKKQNLLVIYPEQFGTDAEMPIPIDSLTQTIRTNPNALTVNLRRLRNIYLERRRIHRNR
ncbi:MAG: cation:proton antiporter [Prevotella sp.]|nr:cation:proton antiporter [Bacteroides sp.]MCM1367165.1 cation:proton antiporter [Prevotella sp.]